MFGFSNKKRRLLTMQQMIAELNPTSKVALKRACLTATQYDIDKAQRLYDFFVKDMEELPTFDPVPPSWIDKTRATVGDLLGLVKDNREDILQGVSLVRSLLGKGNVADVGNSVAEALPKINE